MSAWTRAVLLFLGLLGLDRFTKWHFMTQPTSSGLFEFQGPIAFVQHQNYGVLANIPVPRLVILFVTAVVLIFLVNALFKAIPKKSLESLAITLILAGAIGNAWDRLVWGFVFDWILLFGRSAINIADLCIAIGLLWYLIDRNREEKIDRDPETT